MNKDWLDFLIIFFFLAGGVIVGGLVGSLILRMLGL